MDVVAADVDGGFLPSAVLSLEEPRMLNELDELAIAHRLSYLDYEVDRYVTNPILESPARSFR